MSVQFKNTFVPFKKQKSWTKKDHILTIMNFVLHYLILCALLVGAIILYSGNETTPMIEGFVNYIRENISLSNRDTNLFVYSFLGLLLVVISIYFYLYHEMRDFLLKQSNTMLVFSIIDFSIIVSVLTGKYIHIYARPMAMCALLVLILVNKKSAFFINFCFCIVMFLVDTLVCDLTGASFVKEAPVYLSLAVGCVSGVFAIYLVDGVSSRIAVFLKGFIISIPMLVTIFVVHFDLSTQILNLVKYLCYGFVSGITAVVYMMSSVPIFESVFNVVTNYRLAEIADPNSKMLMRLKTEAYGTYTHVRAVAMLAESCAMAIGEDALLARAAAFYHDIGKLKKPLYFTENQDKSQGNPHDDLTPELSAEILRSHTKDGYDYIRNHRLPKFLADVALQHHGTMPIRYFYSQAQKFTDGEVDIQSFSYYGPKPQSKIAAIIMIADGSEAMVRSLKDRSHVYVEKAVREIIEERMNNDQFTDCDITMRDIEIIKKTIVYNLSGFHHERIPYPKLKLEHHNSVLDEPQAKAEPEIKSDKQDSTQAADKPKKRTTKKKPNPKAEINSRNDSKIKNIL